MHQTLYYVVWIHQWKRQVESMSIYKVRELGEKEIIKEKVNL